MENKEMNEKNKSSAETENRTASEAPIKKVSKKSDPVLSAMGVIFCIILVPILVMNIVLIVQSFTSDNSTLPNIGGKFPLMVQSGSMSPMIETGDLIIVSTPEKGYEYKVQDIITFWDDEPGGALVTHRIAEITKDDQGVTAYRTKGDANSAQDADPVYEKDIVGIYDMRIPHLGDVALFMQTVPGLIVCVVLPLALFVVYDVIRRRNLSKAEQEETAALLAELEKLRAEQNTKNE